MLFLIVKRVHYSLGNNKWGQTYDKPAFEQLIVCKRGTQMSTKWLFVKNFIAYVQPLNVFLSWSFFAKISFTPKGTQLPRFPWYCLLFNFCYAIKNHPNVPSLETPGFSGQHNTRFGKMLGVNTNTR